MVVLGGAGDFEESGGDVGGGVVDFEDEFRGGDRGIELDAVDGLVVGLAGVEDVALFIEDTVAADAVGHEVFGVAPLGGFHGVVVVGIEVESDLRDGPRGLPGEREAGVWVGEIGGQALDAIQGLVYPFLRSCRE